MQRISGGRRLGYHVPQMDAAAISSREHQLSRQRQQPQQQQQQPQQPRQQQPPSPQYPSALPSELVEKYRKRPAVGTVIVGEELPCDLHREESLFEMVTPLLDPELKDIITERVQSAATSCVDAGGGGSSAFSLSLREVSSNGQHRNDDGGLLSRMTDSPRYTQRSHSKDLLERISVPTSPRCHQEEDLCQRRHLSRQEKGKPRKFLKEGGYVIFSDDYIKAHPHSPIASITHEYQCMSPSASLTNPPQYSLAIEGEDVEKRKQAVVQSYVKEAETESRPLFRRKRSEMVYGRAHYLKPEDFAPFSDEEVEVETPGVVMVVKTDVLKSDVRAASDANTPHRGTNERTLPPNASLDRST